MTKIEKFEQNMIHNSMNESVFLEYQQHLKHVRGNYQKCQHCYTTAIQFPPERSREAIRLIDHALENYSDGWFTNYTCHLFIGQIYVRAGSYVQAYEAFSHARTALGAQQIAYDRALSLELLWTRLHLDGFSYSEELELYYHHFNSLDSFSKDLVRNHYRMAIAEIVLALHDQDFHRGKIAYQTACQLLEPGYRGPLFFLLHRKKFAEAVEATPESISFLKKLKI